MVTTKTSTATTAEVIAVGKRGFVVGMSYGRGTEYAYETAKAFMDNAFTGPVVIAAANATPPFYSKCTTKRDALTFLGRHVERLPIGS